VPIRIEGSDATEALREYMLRRPDPKGPKAPLFAWKDGTPLQHSLLIARAEELIKRALPPQTDRKSGRPYVGVSFRAGGATALGEKGVPDRIIQELGRWKSFAYANYVHSSEELISSIFHNL
jgi:hypothetical protein